MPHPRRGGDEGAVSTRLLLGFFALYLVALTFPGYALFAHARPEIFGFPASFAWVILWVILGWVALAAKFRADRRRP